MLINIIRLIIWIGRLYYKLQKVEEVDGIISNSEVVMQNVAYVCEELGLRGNTLESIRNIGEKNLFRKLQNRIGVFCTKADGCRYNGKCYPSNKRNEFASIDKAM